MRRARFLFWLDVILLLAFALDEEPRPTGLAAHEWLGIGLVALIGLHLVVNWRWITNAISRLRSNTRRARVNFALNAALYVFMLVTIFSGLLISEVALAPVGYVPSDLVAWRQLHSLAGNIVLVIVGLHVALNWDWITNVAKKLWARRGHVEVHGTRTLAQRLGIDDLGATGRRLVALTVVTLVLCALTWLPVAALGHARIRRAFAVSRLDIVDAKGEAGGESTDLAEAAGEVGLQLLIIAGVAVAGRKILRLKL